MKRNLNIFSQQNTTFDGHDAEEMNNVIEDTIMPHMEKKIFFWKTK